MSNSNTVASTWDRPFEPPEKIPGEADVVVIGGGIVGVSTAWFLARQGVRVVLCEKGHIAGEQSGRNWGWVRVQGRDAREIPMMQEALRIWDGFKEETGEDVGFVRQGCTFAARTDKEMRDFENWIEVAREYEIDSRLIDAAELGKHVRDPAIDWAGDSDFLRGTRSRNQWWSRFCRGDRAWGHQHFGRSLRGRRLDLFILPLAGRRGSTAQGAGHCRANCSRCRRA
jgi:glycine/D-amino acid oxidase-like deaminating enzyme